VSDSYGLSEQVQLSKRLQDLVPTENGEGRFSRCAGRTATDDRAPSSVERPPVPDTRVQCDDGSDASDQQSALGGRARQRAASRPKYRLGKDSVANLSQVITIDSTLLSERVGRVSRTQIELLFTGLDLVLGRWPHAAVSVVVRPSPAPRRPASSNRLALGCSNWRYLRTLVGVQMRPDHAPPGFRRRAPARSNSRVAWPAG